MFLHKDYKQKKKKKKHKTFFKFMAPVPKVNNNRMLE